MCGQHPHSCLGCCHGLHRRSFLKGCGAAAAAGLLTPMAGAAEETTGRPVRVALVFLANSAEHEIWPYPGYDCAAREQEILKTLKEGCPQVEFVPVVVAHPADAQKATALKDTVDGYLVYTVTLNWGLSGALRQIGQLGKPMLVADEYLGGSGLFLCAIAGLRRQGVAMGTVSTTRPADLVAVARLFAGVKKPGTTPASFAKQCDEVYRRTFAAPGEMKCVEDKVPLHGIGQCVKRLKESRFLIVGAGPSGQERDFLGAKGIYVGFDEFKVLCERADRDEAAEWGRRWSQRADKVVEPTADWIAKAGGVYLAMLALLKKHGTDSITMNCLGGFGSGQLSAYPCLGFMQILDDGGQGVCEAMPDDSVSMLMARILTGRAGYVSDPALDTSKNQVVYSHCMAHTKVFGPKGEANRFRIRTLHNRDPRGCCAESLLPEGYMTTSFRTSIGAKKMVIHQAKAVGNLQADRGCRTQLLGEVRGDIGKLFGEWDRFGWHRVTVYGDVQEPLIEFGRALGLETIREA
jgi:hypothetical protein